jgi:hypothetical protein
VIIRLSVTLHLRYQCSDKIHSQLFITTERTLLCTVLIQALKMALAANCNIIVALNKVDRIPKGPERTSARARVLAQLIQLGLVPEEYGGNCCALMGRLHCILDGI